MVWGLTFKSLIIWGWVEELSKKEKGLTTWTTVRRLRGGEGVRGGGRGYKVDKW